MHCEFLDVRKRPVACLMLGFSTAEWANFAAMSITTAYKHSVLLLVSVFVCQRNSLCIASLRSNLNWDLSAGACSVITDSHSSRVNLVLVCDGLAPFVVSDDGYVGCLIDDRSNRLGQRYGLWLRLRCRIANKSLLLSDFTCGFVTHLDHLERAGIFLVDGFSLGHRHLCASASILVANLDGLDWLSGVNMHVIVVGVVCILMMDDFVDMVVLANNLDRLFRSRVTHNDSVSLSLSCLVISKMNFIEFAAFGMRARCL